MESKFFVWARGRWREVCAQSGRVQGAGAARFLFARDGRLHVARASRVLGALRALASRQPGAVRDGPPLPQRRSGLSKRRRSRSGCRHRHCCCDTRGHGCITSKDVPIEAIAPNRTDAGVQAEVIIPPAPIEVIIPPAPIEAARVTDPSPDKPNQPRAKRVRTSSSSDESCSLSAMKLRHDCKELVIDEQDVDLYRSYLLRNDPSFDSYRFDTDDAFKLHVFYRINPLVSLRRCARLERMLARRRRTQDTLSLKDFATKLGLRSVSDQESEKSQRYRMRRRDRKLQQIEEEKKLLESDSKSDETDKENRRQSDRNQAPPPDRTLRKRLMVEAVRRNVSEMSLKSVPSSQSSNSAKPAPLAAQALSSSSDDDFVKKPTVVAKNPTVVAKNPTVVAKNPTVVAKNPTVVAKKPTVVAKNPTVVAKNSTVVAKNSTVVAKNPTVVAKKPASEKNPLKFLSQPPKLKAKWCGGGREYTTREDHAIVAFVSGGDRAHKVNGNRVWRELQEQYPRLTGQSRSWHSLRNRYLRYVLPALGALALPPADATRLRAAAARGEIKSRARFSAPPGGAEPRVRSAWGALPRPRPPASPPASPDTSPEPPAPPAQRPRRSPASASKRRRSPPAPASAPASAPATAASSTSERMRRREDASSPSASPPLTPPAPRRRRLLRSSGVSLPPLSSPPPFRAPPTALPRAAVRPRLRKLFNHNA